MERCHRSKQEHLEDVAVEGGTILLSHHKTPWLTNLMEKGRLARNNQSMDFITLHDIASEPRNHRPRGNYFYASIQGSTEKLEGSEVKTNADKLI